MAYGRTFRYLMAILLACLTIASIIFTIRVLQERNQFIGLATGIDGPSTVTRMYNVTQVIGASRVKVTLTLTPLYVETFAAVEENIPPGFTVLDAGGGTWDAVHRTLKWFLIDVDSPSTPIPQAELTKSYVLLTPSAEGTYSLAGQYEFEGDALPASTAGQTDITVLPCTLAWSCTAWSSGSCGDRTCICSCAGGIGCTGDATLHTDCLPSVDGGSSPFVFKGGGSPSVFKGGGGYIPRNATSTAKDVCSDSKDNEGTVPAENGCIDAKDALCGGIESACFGGIDNDCDGKVDCADLDCTADSSCQEQQQQMQEPVFTVSDALNHALDQGQRPAGKSAGESFKSVTAVRTFFGFLNWLIIGILCLLFISLIVLQHAKPRDPVPRSDLDKVASYIRRHLKRGESKEEIRRRLKGVGWINEVIERGFNKAS